MVENVATEKQSKKPLSKRIRFEVFKRDSFKCQYCGATAPEVVLHVDHIKPVSQGGSDDLTNLITSCAPCNIGKRDKKLDDNTAISKARIQMEQLQERREQLEMMMKWREGLRDLNQDALNRLCEYWHKHAPGYIINENGQKDIKKWLHKFSIEEITFAMDVAADFYLKFNEDGSVTPESWGEAFVKIPGICRVERDSKENPELKDLYYIRGIARNRCEYFNNQEALNWLKAARDWDVEMGELRQIACSCRSWTNFRDSIIDAIENKKELEAQKEK